MPQYLIQRNIPGAGRLSSDELKAISQKSCGVLTTLGPQIQWVHSYVTDDQIHCIYRAPMRTWFASTPAKAAFPRTVSRRSRLSSTQRRPSSVALLVQSAHVV